MIYLDYAATTPVAPQVAQKMQQYLTLDGVFGNPASTTHAFGWEAARAVEAARLQVALLINADPREIVFTSGATEANNLAIKGLAEAYPEKQHIITCATEHKAVLDCCKALEKKGYEISYLMPDQFGLLDLEKISAAIRENTLLISIMTVNNETGVIQNIAAIAELAKANGIFMHTDASQSIGKLPFDTQKIPVDLISISSHKIYGPKGIGALYVRQKPQINLIEQIHGGSHEHGLRSGTLPTHQIVGLGEALHLANTQTTADHQHAKILQTQFRNALSEVEGLHFNAKENTHIPQIQSLRIDGINNEALMFSCPELAFSAGSACTSTSPDISHVLRAMGFNRRAADQTIRISFGRYTTEDAIMIATEQLKQNIAQLRSQSALWRGR